jgi:hypothetical protein
MGQEKHNSLSFAFILTVVYSLDLNCLENITDVLVSMIYPLTASFPKKSWLIPESATESTSQREWYIDVKTE